MREALCVSVFVCEAVVKSQELSHLVGAVALGGLFAVMAITERRSREP